jgi:hypothetical protein
MDRYNRVAGGACCRAATHCGRPLSSNVWGRSGTTHATKTCFEKAGTATFTTAGRPEVLALRSLQQLSSRRAACGSMAVLWCGHPHGSIAVSEWRQASAAPLWAVA